MNEINEKNFIPEQNEGAESNTTAEKTFSQEHDAKSFFKTAADRLRNVNRWHEYAGPLSAKFTLCDSNGKPVERPVQLNDHFQIEGPGPSSVAGEGYDWVEVESIEEHANADEEIFVITVRPVTNPLNDKEDVAHFFSDKATSSFLVKRDHLSVKTEVHGRNEKPNIKADNIIDKARNALAGAVAVTFYSKFQWKSLVEGISKTDD